MRRRGREGGRKGRGGSERKREREREGEREGRGGEGVRERERERERGRGREREREGERGREGESAYYAVDVTVYAERKVLFYAQTCLLFLCEVPCVHPTVGI